MSTKENEIKVDGQEKEMKIIEGYRNTISSIIRFVSLFSGISVALLVLGFIRADYYYSSLGAGWIKSEIPLIHIIGLSWYPGLALLFGLLLKFSDFSNNLSNKQELIICLIITFIFLFALTGAYICDLRANFDMSVTFHWYKIFSLALIIGTLFGDLILQFQKRLLWTIKIIFGVFVYTFLFIYSVGSLGSAEGKRDANFEQSRLYVVEKIDGEQLRLILNKNGLFYAAQLSKDTKPKVTILNSSDILYIYKNSVKLK